MWGATGIALDVFPVLRISIHAPLVGRDGVIRLIWEEFNLISIHAPLVGRDYGNMAIGTLPSLISIHAPLVGRDVGLINRLIHV